jgi:hypothetical protein
MFSKEKELLFEDMIVPREKKVQVAPQSNLNSFLET